MASTPRKDLPNSSAPNWSQRVTEELRVLMGRAGKGRALTADDLITAGIAKPGAGGALAAWGGTLLVAGMSACLVMTGSTLKRRAIPNRTLLFGVVGAVVGMFVIPVVGLLIGFVVGLLLSETVRNRNLTTALETSWIAAKAMGLGMLVELSCALLASLTFIVGAIIFFATHA